jgi:single-strand DNA-binding protein
MSKSLNRASLVGNLGRDPESRTMQSGGKVVTFSLATTDQWTDRASGEKKSATQWHRVVIYNEVLGDLSEKYLKKGSRVMVEGRIESRKYTDQSGNERDTTEIVLRQINAQLILLDGRQQDGEGGASPARSGGAGGRDAGRGGDGTRAASRPPPGRPSRDMDDDIPF